MEDIIVPIAAFAMIAALVLAPRYWRSRERQKMAETLKSAIDAGQPIPPEFAKALADDPRPLPTPTRDLRRGLILVAVALALAAMGLSLGAGGHSDALHPMVGAAAFPGFIGLALIGMWYAGRTRD